MIIHMVSEHASPLAVLGGADAGGQNVHVAALATALGARGHQVTVHTRRDAPDLPDRVRLAPGVVVEHVPAGPPRPIPKDELLPHMPRFAEWLGRRWLSERPDVVHAHFWMSGYAALAAARDLDVPVAQTFHALGSVKRRYQREADTSPPERRWLEPRVAREADVVIATCSSEVQELCAYRVHPDSAVVIPCGVDLELFRPRGPVAPRGDRPRVLSIGRMVPRKGIDTVIAALAAVPGAELVVAGGPALPELDGDAEARRLRALAAEYGVADRVVFTGRVPHEEAPALMRSADVVASVPWYEPFGMVPVEAMACGTPVVASAVGGHLDTVIDGVTGLHAPPRDPAALAGRLREVLGDERWRSRLGRTGARRAHALYSWDRIAATTESVYERLAGLRAGAAVAGRAGGPAGGLVGSTKGARS
ncbi:Glycosyltransferase involved in cell wall bisynthesis [Thermomonospora echinospora]|uniref:Glycosyltransferase involved in cell wall bisynthesis n=1 Tax=Thermomonospora echinospora TaxID=1992 RepID=A0A1H6BYN1_9ACTN|nr:glycosyltransferase [Thermomonospora echinospora]SEG65772.1 Glycosyltransferase involved in cell wall bisynthesis [Thermomonospora echinospora]